jgi:hypothetical protein
MDARTEKIILFSRCLNSTLVARPRATLLKKNKLNGHIGSYIHIIYFIYKINSK